MEWFNKRHRDGGLREKAVAEKRRLAAVAAATSGQWRAIGPQPIQLIYTPSWSGRVWGIGVDPRNSSVIYIGTDGGGVWKTTDGATTWLPLTDSQANLSIRDLTLAPSAPDTILAATSGGGILKSTDDGATWTTFHPSSGDYTLSVAVHPTSALIVLVGGCGAISRSADGGSTWSTTLSVQGNCLLQQTVFDPTNGSIAYAAMSDGLHRSTDTGLTWNLVAGAGLPAGPFGSVTVAVAPSSPTILYLALKGSNNLLLGFYRSTDSGATWTQVGVPPNDDIPYWGWSLRVHPTNPNLIYAGSLTLSMSTDGGKTWTPNGNSLHVDQHVQAYSADGKTLYAGNDGGIWSTPTSAAANTPWMSLNNSLNTALFYPGISIDPFTVNTTYGGTQDNGTLQYQGALSWNVTLTCGDGGFTAIDFVQPQNVFSACAGQLSILKSADGGKTFAGAQSGIDIHDGSDFVPPLIMDPGNSSRLYFGTYRVYQTVDGANSWNAISPDLTAGTEIATIAVAPSDPNSVYTGSASSNGMVFVTRNALAGTGATWTPANLPFAQSLTHITVDPSDPLTAWAAVVGPAYNSRGLVYRTKNGGSSWTNQSTGLPNLTVSDLLLDPDIANTIYAATDVGVYRSVDGGQSWLPLGSGLPNVIVHAIRLDRPTRTLRAATYGRGMWDLPVPVSGQVAVTVSANVAGAVFSLEDGSVHLAPISFYWYTGAQHTVTWLSSPPGLPNAKFVFQNWSDSSTANPRTITVQASNATYTANLSAQYLLTTAVTPASTGSVLASPASPDGFYNLGQAVTITAIGAPGYFFSFFTGDVSETGVSTQTITMDGPRSVTAHFGCSFFSTYWLPNEIGPGPLSGMLIWPQGVGCQTSAISDSAWLVLGPQTVSNGFNAIPYSISGNTGASRVANVSFSGDFSTTLQLTQDPAGSTLPNIVSFSPASGNAATQVFTLQAYDAGGFAQIGQVYFVITGFDGLQCSVQVYPLYDQLSLAADSGTFPGSGLTLPGTATMQNSQCLLSAATSSISGSGNVLTVSLGIGFKSAFGGSRYLSAEAYDSVALTRGPYVTVGTWSVSAGPPVLSVAKTADSATVAVGSSIGFTVTASNSSAHGTGTAAGVTLNDPLPAGAGINWSISPAYSGPGTCSITGATGSQTLGCSLGDLVLGAMASVHVASGTSPASCGVYANTATLAGSGIAALQASATSTVQCPALTVSGPARLPAGAVGVSYFPTTVVATGGTGIYTWSATGLPGGLIIGTSSGVISGTPATTAGSPFTVAVTVQDSNSASAHRSYSLTVLPSSPCDVKQNGIVNVADVQTMVNEALGVISEGNDLNGDGMVNVLDIQMEINAALGAGCAAQ